MAWLVSLLGAALALAGAVSLGNGVSYIRLDWGQTETVAGTVALSAGVVTLGLGAVLFALRDLAGRVAAPQAGVGMEALTWSEDDAPAPRPILSRVKSRLATVGVAKTPLAPTLVPETPAAPDVALAGDRPSPAPSRRSSPPAEPSAEPSAEPPPVQRPPVYAPQEPDPMPAAAFAEAPTVVGRYESNGASYVLFSDGTIEVETESGTHRFSSMADLKAHIERQEVG